MSTFLLLVNDRSGRGRATVTARMLGRLIQDAALGRVLGPFACQASAQWQPLLNTQARMTVLVCGGDGSLHHLLKHMDTRHLIMPVPVGTANLMAHELGLKMHLKQIMQALQRGHEVQVPCLRTELSGEQATPIHAGVMHHASFGFDADVIRAMHHHRRGPIRKKDYYKLTLAMMRHYQPSPLRIWLNGEDRGTFSSGIITFGRYYADKRLVLPGYQPGLVVWRCLLWRHWSPKSMMIRLWHGLRGAWPEEEGRLEAPLTDLRWQAVEQPVSWQVDGEWLGAGQSGALMLEGGVSWCYLGMPQPE